MVEIVIVAPRERGWAGRVRVAASVLSVTHRGEPGGGGIHDHRAAFHVW
jgi:hypothetical protein